MNLIDEIRASYLALSRIMQDLGQHSVDVVARCIDAIGTRAALDLEPGYTSISPTIGICLSGDGSGDLVAPSPSRVEITLHAAEWLTVEMAIPHQKKRFSSVIECELAGHVPITVDLFVRDFTGEDHFVDNDPREFMIVPGNLATMVMDYDNAADDAPRVRSRRLIILFRTPPETLPIARLRSYII